MGSGKGKARRAAALTVAPRRTLAHSDPMKWLRFLKKQGIRNVTVAKYYGTELSEPAKKKLTAAGVESVLEEMLRDWVGLGALTLSENRSVEDYEFRVEDSLLRKTPNEPPEKIKVFLVDQQGDEDGEVYLLYPDRWLGVHTRLWSADMLYLLERLGDCMNE